MAIPHPLGHVRNEHQKTASPIERSETKHERSAHSIVKVHTDQMKVNAVDMDLLQVEKINDSLDSTAVSCAMLSIAVQDD